MIKNICKNIITDAARHVSTVIIAVVCFLPSCKDYLDIVPDKSFTMESIFSVKEDAYAALAKIYYYMPNDSKRASRWLLGDEWVQALWCNSDYSVWVPIRIMERRQNETNPILGTWSGTGSAKPLYQGINSCNIFINMIDQVLDMAPAEKADWKAQAIFLKAYYHFMLLQQYGPVVIMDNAISPDDEPETLYASRSKIDECFDYIVRTMDKAIPDLEMKRRGSDLGQIDRLGATAIKARVLLYRASPFYSANGDYADFYDHDDKLFFPQDDAATTKAKWEDAVKAIDEAITLCESNGVALYKYNKSMLTDDLEDAQANPVNMQILYDLRMLICDQWNRELIWGSSNVLASDGDLFSDGNIMLPTGYTGTTMNRNYCRNELGATYKNLERYYTKNGLPLDEDNTFDRSAMYDLTHTPAPTDPEYAQTRGILQPNAETIQLYLNREPRFYANVGITGGYWRAHSDRISTTFYANGPGGFYSGYSNNFFWTAIGAQKQIHIDSKSGDGRYIETYPTPIIRLADLYLMKAEALNESLDAPNAEVYAAINKVRQRAGIPNVETAYTGNFVTSDAAGKHTRKTGMREIIAHERKVEFAFEGHIFWDMIRTRKAPNEFSSPAMGWNYAASEGAIFFNRKVVQTRIFTLRDCLWPIDLAELTTNANLIQNPGW